MTDPKEIERKRYDDRAIVSLKTAYLNSKNKDDEYLLPPLNHYREILSNFRKDSRVLELGAGMGENTEILVKKGYEITASDISINSLRVLKERFKLYSNLTVKEADIELLPFDDEYFDIVCSAGVLSYGDPKTVQDEIYRVLKRGGTFVAVDTLNHNPIYKLNRYLHYLKNNRSKSTLERMPTIQTIECYKNIFGYAEVKFFGSIIWSAPILIKLLGERIFSIASRRVDKIFSIKKSAFKFVMLVIKK